jgi:hypothetical protein
MERNSKGESEVVVGKWSIESIFLRPFSVFWPCKRKFYICPLEGNKHRGSNMRVCKRKKLLYECNRIADLLYAYNRWEAGAVYGISATLSSNPHYCFAFLFW